MKLPYHSLPKSQIPPIHSSSSRVAATITTIRHQNRNNKIELKLAKIAYKDAAYRSTHPANARDDETRSSARNEDLPQHLLNALCKRNAKGRQERIAKQTRRERRKKLVSQEETGNNNNNFTRKQNASPLNKTVSPNESVHPRVFSTM
jgi:hypothetical protein